MNCYWHKAFFVALLSFSLWPFSLCQAQSSSAMVDTTTRQMVAIQHNGLIYPLVPTRLSVADYVIEEACRYIGTPYRWGGQSPSGFDCAGFVRYVYGKFGVELASGAVPQVKAGPAVKTEDLAKGDLVFFEGRTINGRVGHVGIVTSVADDGKSFQFIHASTSLGVIISSSNEAYYKKRYRCACRVVDRIVTNLPVARPAAKPLPKHLSGNDSDPVDTNRPPWHVDVN